MAFVSFHAIEEFLGIPPIPFHYDGLYPFPAASGEKISKAARSLRKPIPRPKYHPAIYQVG
jgi:hypothetical protein